MLMVLATLVGTILISFHVSSLKLRRSVGACFQGKACRASSAPGRKAGSGGNTARTGKEENQGRETEEPLFRPPAAVHKERRTCVLAATQRRRNDMASPRNG